MAQYYNGILKSLSKSFTFRPKKRHREADAIKRAARLSFPSRQPSPKITGTSEQNGLLSGSDPVAFEITKDVASWILDQTAGLGAGQALA